MSNCQSCQAEVLWLRNINTDKLAPIDAFPSPVGNIRVLPGSYATLAPSEATEARAEGIRLHLNHFVTCPNAASHHRGGD